MLTRLWESERPDVVLVAWDTLEVPTYRHEAFDAYQSGRVFEDSLLEQLAVMPGLTESLGFTLATSNAGVDCAKAAAVARERVAARETRIGELRNESTALPGTVVS